MIKIVLIDDHKVVLQGLKLSLESSSNELSIIGSFTNPIEAIHFIKTNAVDVVITDLRIPEMSGLEIRNKLSQTKPSVKFIALTSVDDHEVMKQCEQQGFYGYILKNADLDALLDSIVEVSEGRKVFRRQRDRKIIFEEGDGVLLFEKLSVVERKIFSYLTKGMKPSDIAEKEAKSMDTILTQKKKIFEKLQLHSMSQLLRFAYQNNLLS